MNNLIENIEEMPMINGINWNYSIMHLNTIKMIYSTIESFCYSAETDSKELKRYYKNIDEDINSFRVKAHSMKNTAMLLGIIPLYGMAMFLEFSADKCNKDAINDVTPHFIETWNEYSAILSKEFCNEDSSDKIPCDKELLKSLLSQLKLAIDDFDISVADEICKELKNYSYEESLSDNIKSLIGAINCMDTDKAIVIIMEIEVML